MVIVIFAYVHITFKLLLLSSEYTKMVIQYVNKLRLEKQSYM
jgi:hypothetical protein